MKKKADVEDKKSNNPKEALFGFLRLLNTVSLSPGVCEYCTPGHKAGRGFTAMLNGHDRLATLAAEEVG